MTAALFTAALRRVRCALLGLGLLATAATFAWSAPTAADAAGCTAPQVAVLVDLSHWGGSDRVGCVGWTSSLTGVGALGQAGFALTGTRQYGLAFICRIDGYPSAGAPDHESCNSTPPAQKYWSYWHADSGHSSWTYSTLGAASYHPHAGSVDAWTFGGGSAPSVSPSAVLPGAASAPTSPASTTKPHSTHPASTAPTHRSSTASTHHAASAKATSHSAQSTRPPPSAPGAAATTSSGADATTTSADPTSAALGSSTPSLPRSTGGVTIAIGRTPAIVSNRSSAAAASPKPSGSPGPTIAGVVIVAALAAGGGFYAWRRRGPRSHAG